MTDADPELNDETESIMLFVRGASFDKEEFKRNVMGSVSYAPASTVVISENFIPQKEPSTQLINATSFI